MRYIANLKRLIWVFFAFVFFIPPRVFALSTPVINEFSTHPSSENKEWVEIVAPSDIQLTTYWIDDDTSFMDDAGNGSKRSLENSVAGYASDYFIMEVSSLFNNNSDTVVLFTAEGTIVDQYSYTQDSGVEVTIGRYPNATGQFQILSSPSKGESNNPPAPTITPTPIPTQKPAPTEKLENELNATKNPTIKEEDMSQTTDELFIKLSPGAKASPSATSKRFYPSPILGVSTSSAKKKEASQSAKKKTAVLVKDIQSAVPKAAPFLLAGSVLLVSCGILLYNKIRRGN
ncbi:MAG: lamin tail domain-containing protein [Patescibacteria group bacterium]